MMTGDRTAASPALFNALYAVAHVGAFFCFVPLLSLILPQQVVLLSRGDATTSLSWVLLVGGIASSLANIAAGWCSDRLADRRGSRIAMIGYGLAATGFSYVLLAKAGTFAELLIAFILFQIAFNTLFSPLIALPSDHVADQDKGRVFGWMSLAMPLAQCAVIALAWSSADTMAMRLAVVGVAAILLILPFIFFGPGLVAHRPVPADRATVPAVAVGQGRRIVTDFAYAWISRFLIQCSAVAVGSYLFMHLSRLSLVQRGGASVQDTLGNLILISLSGAVITGLFVGFWSDRTGRRLPFLRATATLVGVGCIIMAISGDWRWTAVGYGLFTIGLSGFLTIDGAMIAEIVGKGGLRGTRLGVVNLTNTLPAIFVPLLSLTLGSMISFSTATLYGLVAAGSMCCLIFIGRIKSIL